MEKHDVWEFQLDFLSINQSVALQFQTKQNEKERWLGRESENIVMDTQLTLCKIMKNTKRGEKIKTIVKSLFCTMCLHQQSGYVIAGIFFFVFHYIMITFF